MNNEEISEFRQWIEKAIVGFERQFDIPPTELVMCPLDADLWRQAAADGTPLCDGLDILVNPFVSTSGLRCPAGGPAPARRVLH
ncbi:hypothetical protein E2553_08665 [Paraburkholderia dipogonis]|uniref:Uncharacterized protein n=1 Tax=Paraburkholderia dipogonis TaxID=1211383 RepID=A0A4Y8N5V1_9BURK|nr:hypothetical protein [Paraburkholderia dipogonis]TFE45085.1 hypothetical protein E2553_08665 [Paraburkholderia dipogonis]